MLFHYLSLAAFIAGVLLGVYSMLFGVERQARTPPADPGAAGSREVQARISVPSVAAFLTLFGATGYLLTRYTGLSLPVRFVVAILAGGLGVVGALALVAKWAVPAARREVVDERYTLMGHLAQVTRAIEGSADGEIRYEVEGRPHLTPARSLDAAPIAAGSEVVIERIEDGVAYVEPWLQVERRL